MLPGKRGEERRTTMRRWVVGGGRGRAPGRGEARRERRRLVERKTSTDGNEEV